MKRIPVAVALVTACVFTASSSGAPSTTFRAAIYSVRSDGKGRHLVARPDPPVLALARSPDGRFILFNRDVPGFNSALYAADRSGANAVLLSQPGVSAPFQEAAFSPDGQRIAFSVLHLCGFRCASYTLYLVERDGTGLRLLADQASSPSWSPEGNSLAFYSNYGIRVLDLDSGESKLVAPQGGRPIWAPRGDRIAFTAVVGGYGVACFVNADGSRRRCTHGHTLTSLVWSRGGKRVAFRQFAPRRIGIVDPDARHVRILGFFGRWAQPAGFAPDGKRVAIWSGAYGSFSGPVMVVPVKRPPRARRLFDEPGASLSDLRWRASGMTYVAVRPEEP